MLRGRPSEITLTAADVEQTRLRMDRRQTAAPLAGRSGQSLRTANSRGSRLGSGFPRLRRGPDRSRDDAITQLGPIPLLQPHNVVHSSVDSESDDDPIVPSLVDSLFLDAGDLTNTSLSQGQPSNECLSVAGGSVLVPDVSNQTADPNQAANPSNEGSRPSVSAGNDYEGEDSAATRRYQFDYSGFGQAGTNPSEDIGGDAPESQPQSSTDGVVEVASETAFNSYEPAFNSYEPASPLRFQTLRQHNSHIPSPLHQAQRASSPRSTHVDGEATPTQTPTRREPPQLRLEGYFATPDRYWFRELSNAPHTEPRQALVRSRMRIRSVSSPSDPSTVPSILEGLNLGLDSPSEDVFSTGLRQGASRVDQTTDSRGPSTEELRTSTETIRARPLDVAESLQSGYSSTSQPSTELQQEEDISSEPQRHHVSQQFREESSASSQPYSLYELPGSRQSSSTYSQVDGPLQQAQYDGAAPSRPMAGGAYYSIRSSQIHPLADVALASTSGAANLAPPSEGPVLVGHGLSRLPARPYARVEASTTGNTLRPSLISAFDLVGGDQDATSAIERNLSSPLEVLELRAVSLLSQLSLGPRRGSSSAEDHPIRGPSAFQYQVANHGHANPARERVPGSSEAYTSNNTNGTRGVVDDRYPDFPSAQETRSSNHPENAQDLSRQATQRRTLTTRRSQQRSSENDLRAASTFDISALPSRGFDGQRRNPPQQYTASRFMSNRNSIHAQASSSTLRSARTRPSSPPSRGNSARPRSSRGPFPQGRLSQFSQDPQRGRNSGPFDSSSSPVQPYGDGHSSAYRRPLPNYRTTISPPPTTDPRTSLSPPFVNGRVVSSPPVNNSRMSNISPVDGEEPNVNEAQVRHPAHFAPRPSAPHPGRQVFFQADEPGQLGNLRSEPGNTRPQYRGGGPGGPGPLRRRRMPSSQQDQENSLDAEMGMMRNEMVAAGMRYAQDGHPEVMDDTPPRLGRFERHMRGE
ncbi:hypothetical protein GQ43DRAFT_73548 [Delitschia confertaspora ATCC 74209]|uniref:Uncharacterized protein n=1 Tax=Delitschia confertaspora ATCC 74209 TaxID=1513339 RepID=A0A9P4JP30_9PLEO|nr:hypothetical protein GQ43DRAFT_73548 [Delitschia confertaspora ATCC 74209]